MKITLVYPPFADATQPYSSLPALAAYIRSRERHEVELYDANLDTVLYFLSREQIESAASRITDRIRSLERGDKPSGRNAQEYALALAASLKAPIVAARIEDAIAAFRDAETFSDLTRLNCARRLYDDAIDVLDAAWHPLGLRPSGLSEPDRAKASAIDSVACDAARNPFLPVLKAIALPELERSGAGAVGISITYQTQILPAVTLAKLIRQLMPAVPVIFGGQMVSVWHENLANCPEIFDWCDYLIAFEGESALERLLSALEDSREPLGVPNLAYLSKGRVRIHPTAVEDIDALPTPDYTGLPLERYLAPEPVFLLNTSRGCYWSKCEFCAVSPAMRNGCRIRGTDLVIRDITALQQKHSAHCVAFGDDCVPPRTLQELAHGLISAGISLSWQCEVRFERALTAELLADLRKAGCRNLIFGLESYSTRVLGLMSKGVQFAEIARVLDDCRRNQIAFNLQLFFGFPGETPQEARETLEFVTGQLRGAATVSFGEFKLLRGSGVARRPGDFGIHLSPNAESLAVSLNYQPTPAHAEQLKNELRAEVLNRSRFKGLPLGIGAHTLLYLHRAGVPSMTDRYYHAPASPGPPRTTLPFDRADRHVRRPWQSISEFRDWETSSSRRILLYDYELDRTVELSNLALWIITCGLDEPRSATEVAYELARLSQEPFDSVLPIVIEVVTSLRDRGLLQVVETGHPRAVSDSKEAA